MSLWNGHLRNSAVDIIIDTSLAISIVVAYAPQISRIFWRGSAQGISPYFLLFNAIFSNAQLSQALLLAGYTYPNDTESVLHLIADGRLVGTAAFGGVLGFVQIALQWACSITLVILYASLPANGRSQGILSSRAGIAAATFTHAAVFLFPVIAITLPKPAPHEIGTDMFIGFAAIMNTLIAPFFVILQFLPQYLEMRRTIGEAGSLSLLSLSLQMLVLVGVAIRWFLRLGSPTWGNAPTSPFLWYQWGVLPFNYLIHAIGCAVLLAMYILTTHCRDSAATAAETRPLLA